MKIWLDMANSPHPVLFGPLSRTLRQRGHDLWVTVRDHAQTLPLSRQDWPDAEVVGSASPASRLGKTLGIGGRIVQLAWRAGAEKPDVAVSLNSYAQIAAAKLARVPSVTLMDYEYQPANHLAFRLATRVVVPKVFPDGALARFGASPERVTRFDGFKEELYLDRTFDLPAWPTERDPDLIYALFRPPPVGALYHSGDNARFAALVAEAAQRDDVRALVLPRWETQRAAYSRNGLDVPTHVLDGLATLRSIDIFIGAGGTMSREAALLGVEAYTMFAGSLASVDSELIASGRLRDLRYANRHDFEWRARRGNELRHDVESCAARASELREWLTGIIEEVSGATLPRASLRA